MPRATAPARFETIADILRGLGVPPRRIRADPPPGKATEGDLLRLHARTDRLFELVDGVLVEKPVGVIESYLAGEFIVRLREAIDPQDLGIVLTPDNPMRLLPGIVRLPDVSFVAWDRLPVRGELPTEAIASYPPDLAVEILSKSNTRKEMDRKLREYFLSGTQLVWYVDPVARTVQVFTAPDRTLTLMENQTLDGGAVVPGLAMPLARVFARVPRLSAQRAKVKKPRRR